MICTTLNDLNCVEWFTQRWIICTGLSYLDSVEWFILRWMIWTTLNYLYSVELSVQRWMICTTLKNLYHAAWFGVRWMICTSLNHLDYNELLSIGFLMSVGCAYSRKYCKIFYTNLWVDFFLICKYQEKIYSALPQKSVIKRCF